MLKLPPRLPAGDPHGYDLVLSSGFLSFANHAGFLQAVDDVGLIVNGVCGTSAGAMVGSLYCAGYTPREASASARTAASATWACYSARTPGLTLDCRRPLDPFRSHAVRLRAAPPDWAPASRLARLAPADPRPVLPAAAHVSPGRVRQPHLRARPAHAASGGAHAARAAARHV